MRKSSEARSKHPRSFQALSGLEKFYPWLYQNSSTRCLTVHAENNRVNSTDLRKEHANVALDLRTTCELKRDQQRLPPANLRSTLPARWPVNFPERAATCPFTITRYMPLGY
jgi:hypothetical protein